MTLARSGRTVAVGRAAMQAPVRHQNPPGPRGLTRLPHDTLALLLVQSYRRELTNGLRLLMIAAGLVVPLAAFVPLNGAVVATGHLISESNVKKVQHPTGGVVSDILVEDGAQVTRGDVVARLDAKQATSNLAVVAGELVEARMCEARLIAERDHVAAPQWPDLALAGLSPNAVATVEATQEALFEARGREQQSSVSLLKQEIEELNDQVSGLRAELASKSKQGKIVAEELAGLERLYNQRLVTLNRLSAERREASSLSGDAQQLSAQIEQIGAKIRGTKMQIKHLRESATKDILKDLAEAQEKQRTLTQQYAAALEQLKHLDIQAPQSGIVHELAVHTVGGVIGPGEVLMLVTPTTDSLVIESRLQTKDIDQIHVGQSATVVMPALDRAATPRLQGSVIYVSPDAARDAQNSTSYYTVRVALDKAAAAGLRLVAGMPVETFFETQSRSMASYLFKPLTDQMARMFRDR